MNRVLVSQAAAGLAAYLLEQADGGRRSSSSATTAARTRDVFATDTAELMAGAGVRAILLPRLLPTPVLAFAVRHLDTSAGVMVTASHNPPQRQRLQGLPGRRRRGSQIVSPADAEIAAHILRVAARDAVPDLPRGTLRARGEDVVDEYVRAHRRVSRRGTRASSRFVYTAMHGVGWETAPRVFAAAGFAAPTLVAEQIEPDAAVPDRRFPQPRGARRHGPRLRQARRPGADLDHRQRSGCRPAGRGHPRSAARQLAAPQRQRGRRPARLAGRDGWRGTAATARLPLDRLTPAARRDRPPYRLDYATRSPASSGCRAPRGSPTASRRRSATCRPGGAPRQGRHLGGRAFLAMAAELKAAATSPDHETSSPRIRGATPPPDLDPGRATSPRSPGSWSGCGRTAGASARCGSTASTTSRTGSAVPAQRHPAHRARGRLPGHPAAERHRAEAQDLHRRVEHRWHRRGAHCAGARNGRGARRGFRPPARLRAAAGPLRAAGIPIRRTSERSFAAISRDDTRVVEDVGELRDRRMWASGCTMASPSTTLTGSLCGCPKKTGVDSVTTASPSASTSGPGRACASASPGAITTYGPCSSIIRIISSA